MLLGFNALNLDLSELDLCELILLALCLLNDEPQIMFADLALCKFFEDTVLVLHASHFSVLLVKQLLPVVPLLQQVLVDHCDSGLSHILLLLFVGFSKLIYDFFVPVLELTRMINLRVQIYDHLFL